ncbi:serine hydrolase [Aquimarina sp. AU119]|uniref:serine hydrolase domain-containing protein n=1 Tax=Aquimarina sp. AU119 TaxID=2108528 RepID=UPI000D69A309|nr:serine hydrolase [Aquimarina sp. AU119]
MKKLLVIVAPSMVFVALLFSFASGEHSELSQQPQVVQVPETLPDIHFPASQKQQLIASIQTYFDQALDQNQIVGASVAIVKCDSIIYLGGYGNKNSRSKDTINEETIFRIGSVSKGFAGILAGIHVEEGLINWEDKVKDYIPDFKLSSKKQTESVTLSHVLSHTTGLPYHSFTNLVEDGIPIRTIASNFKELVPIAKPGGIYSYQNAVFALSGTIVEQVTGKSFKEVLQEKIFDPLHMSSASASYEALEESDNVAEPHQRVRHGWRPMKINKKYYNNAIAAGGINASAKDMGKWMKFLLGNNPEVMMPGSIQSVFTPKIQVGGRRQYYQRWSGYSSSFYGYGWRVHNFVDTQTNEPTTIVHHGGSVNNYRSEIAIFPEEDLGICVLFNSQNSLARTCIPDLHKIIQGIMKTPVEKDLKESLVLL